MTSKRAVCAVGLPAFLLFLCAGCSTAGQAGLTEAGRTAIRQVAETSIAAFNAKDWDSWAAAYAEDAVLLPPNQVAVQGRAAIREWGQALPAASDLRIESVEIEGAGDLAYDRGTYSIVLTGPAGETFTEHGKYVTVLKKQPDGSWKVARDIWNSDLVLPAPHPEGMESAG